jgi:Ser/Thr protein kinase RdoA (MazF antagonist)
MDNHKIEILLEAFSLKVPVSEWKPYGHGHINDTFLIRTPGTIPDLILQRKNHLIFKDIAGMMNNIVLTTNHIRKKLMAAGETDIDRKVMTYLSTAENNHYVKDEEGNYWTLFLFISGSHGIEEVAIPAQAFSAGKAFGHFQNQLSDFPGHLLIETIPRFHNGKFRSGQFTDAVKEDRAGRVGAMQEVIEKLLSRTGDMVKLQDWLDQGVLPLRVTHNDTKINNVLYDESDNILCIIDLDTVMPGSALFDFGDAIRSLGNTAAEDEPDLSKINFNTSYFRSFTEGYLSESRNFLTEKERENLEFSCRYMVWEQSIRFLTDYLNGDTYYKISYPEHNRVRTLAQLRYLEVMEKNRDFMLHTTLNG